jgi:hypothetical protein
MLGCTVFNESETMWKVEAAANLRYYPSILLKELRKTTKTSASVVSVQAEIGTGHL